MLSWSLTSWESWEILLWKMLLSSLAMSEDLESRLSLEISPSQSYFYDWLASFTLNSFLPMFRIRNA